MEFFIANADSATPFYPDGTTTTMPSPDGSRSVTDIISRVLDFAWLITIALVGRILLFYGACEHYDSSVTTILDMRDRILTPLHGLVVTQDDKEWLTQAYHLANDCLQRFLEVKFRIESTWFPMITRDVFRSVYEAWKTKRSYDRWMLKPEGLFVRSFSGPLAVADVVVL